MYLEVLLNQLTAGLEHVLFFHHIGNFIIPADFQIFQTGRAQPPTSQGYQLLTKWDDPPSTLW